MRSIWAFVMTAATVTVYVHVRHNEPIVTHVRHLERATTASEPAPSPSGSIVVARFSGGAVGERWGSTDMAPAPSATPANDPWKNR
jgi:hypothetical protein